MRIVNLCIRKRCGQVIHIRNIRFLVVFLAGKHPEALQCGQRFERRVILNMVKADIQVQQMGQAGKRGQVLDFILEQFRIFQILQGSNRGDVCNMVAGNNQDPQVWQIVQEVQAGDIVVPHIERQEVPAVLQDFKIFTAVLGAGVVMQRGVRGVIRSDQVLMIDAFDNECPAPLDFREAGGEQIAVFQVHFGIPHIHPAQVGHLVQECDQFVKITDCQITQINIFRIFPVVFSIICHIGQDNGREEQQNDQADP